MSEIEFIVTNELADALEWIARLPHERAYVNGRCFFCGATIAIPGLHRADCPYIVIRQSIRVVERKPL